MTPTIIRRWRMMARIGNAITQKMEMVSCFMQIATVQALHKWRSLARDSGRGEIRHGVAMMQIFQRSLRLAWNTWRAVGADEFDSQLNVRRAATRMVLRGMAHCFAGWRAAVRQTNKEQGKARQTVRRLMNRHLFTFFNAWRAEASGGAHDTEKMRSALLGFLMRNMRRALHHWGGITAEKRIRHKDNYGREVRAYLLAHGETQGEADPSTAPTVDEPLSETGRRQAEALSKVLELNFPDVTTAYVSPLARCIETALTVFGTPFAGCEFRAVKLVIETDLRDFDYTQVWRGPRTSERNFGSTIAALKKKFPQKHIVWPPTVGEEDLWWLPQTSYSNIETRATSDDGSVVASCAERIARFKEFALASGEGSFAVVTHPNVLAAFAGSLDMPRCRPFPVLLGYGGFAEMQTSRPIVEALPTNLLQLSERAETAVVVLGLAGTSGGLEPRIHEGLRLMQREPAAPLLILGGAGEFASMHDAVASYPWCLTPIERRRILFQQHAETVDDLGAMVPAVLASLHPGSWRCLIVTSDWALPRCLLTLTVAPRWLTVEPIPILTELEGPAKLTLTEDQLKEGAELGRWAVAAPEEWAGCEQQSARYLYVVGRNLRKWAVEDKRDTSRAQPGSPFSKHEHTKREELFQLLNDHPGKDAHESRQLFADALGEFYDAGVAVAQHPLHSDSSSATLLHQCAAAGAVELAGDLVSFWGADVEALDENGKKPVDLINEADSKGQALQKLLHKAETGATYGAARQ